MQWLGYVCEKHEVLMQIERLRSHPNNEEKWDSPPIHAEVIFLDSATRRPRFFNASVLKDTVLMLNANSADPSAQQPRIVSAVIQHPSNLAAATLETSYMNEEQLRQFELELAPEWAVRNNQKPQEEQEAEEKQAVVDGLRGFGALLIRAADMIQPETKDEGS